MRALRSWALWWLALFWLWNLLQGAWEEMEIAAGAGAAALGATLAEYARRQGLLAFAPPSRTLAKALGAPWRLVFEYGVLTRVAVARALGIREARSVWLAVHYDGGGTDAASQGRRAAAILIENISPNTIGVDIDCDRDAALRHDLDPRFGSSGFPS